LDDLSKHFEEGVAQWAAQQARMAEKTKFRTWSCHISTHRIFAQLVDKTCEFHILRKRCMLWRKTVFTTTIPLISNLTASMNSSSGASTVYIPDHALTMRVEQP
jgi:hypothetical protein